jgi:uncharacterized membrane protein
VNRRVATALVLLAALAGPFWFWDGGLLEVEATAFIRHYGSDRPWLVKIFDPARTDFGAYQARELSYAFDALDAWCYQHIVRRLNPGVFIALSSVMATVLSVIVLLRGMKRSMPNLGVVTAALLVACLVSSFLFLSTLGTYYRSTKPLLTAVVLAFLFHVLRAARQPRPSDARAAGALCLIGGLLDRQGFFYVLVACVILAVDHRVTGRWRGWLKACGGAALLLAVYDLMLGPLLVRALNGYWPDFAFQSETLRSLDWLIHPSYVLRAFDLLSLNIAGLFGGSRSTVVTLVIAGVLAALTIGARPSWSARPVAYAVLMFLAQLMMFAMMIQQHPPVYDYVDHRVWYYPLPFIGTALVGAAMWLNAILPAARVWPQRAVALVLLAAVIGNVAGLDGSRRIFATGPYFSRIFDQSALLKKSFAARAPDPGLDEEYREFYTEQAVRHGK